MITISKSKLIRGALCNLSGQRCLMGEVFHHFGVSDRIMQADGLQDQIFEALEDEKVKRELFYLTDSGYRIFSRTFQDITNYNDTGEPENALHILKRIGIEVELVD